MGCFHVYDRRVGECHWSVHGEWTSAPVAAKRRLGIGVSVLVIAIVGLAASNALM